MPEAVQSGAGSDVPPQLVADHELLRRIGVGAYGEVWLARSVTGVYRAVKVLRRDRFEHDRIYEREFTGLKRFEPISRLHPGLIDVLQVGRDDQAGYFYYVMELADPADSAPGGGEILPESYVPLTLREMVARQGRLPVDECARIGAAMSDALGFLHGEGLVHRDVKPSNILFVGGQAKLADIGLVAGLSDARSFVGTDGYIPPEGPGAAPADLYSLGKVLYEMATGRSRLDFPDLPREMLETVDAAAFAELNEIILRACAPEVAGRHRTAAELRGELLLVDAGRSVRRLRRHERMVVRWRRIGLVAMGLVLLGGAAVWMERQRTVQARSRAMAEAEQRRLVERKELAARQNLYAADINLAQQAVETGNFGRAEELLAEYLPRPGVEDLRGFEWHHFWHRVRGDSIGVLHGHSEVVSSLRLSPDGGQLYSGGFDGTVRRWSLADRRETGRWELPGCAIMAMSLDPAGKRMVVEGGNRPMSGLLDLESGTWKSQVASASPSVAFAPGGDRWVRGARMRLFDTNGVVEVVNLSMRVERVLDRAGGRAWFSPDGRRLVTGSWGDELKVWSWPELEAVGALPGAGMVVGLAFSSDGTRMATGCRDGRLMLWEMSTGRLLRETQGHGGALVWSVAFSPDGHRLASGGNDQTVKVWDGFSLEEQAVFRGHRSEVWSVLWTRDGHQLVSAGKDATIRLWNAVPAVAPLNLEEVAQAPVFSPDEQRVAVRQRNGRVSVWELASGRRMHDWEGIEIGGFSPDGSSLTLLRDVGTVERRAVADGRLLDERPVAVVPGNVSRRRLSPDGRWWVSGMDDGGIRVEDLIGECPGRTFLGHEQQIFALQFSPDGRRLLSGSMDRSARIWDLEAGVELHRFEGHRMAVASGVFSADGTRVVTGSWDDSVRIWETGRPGQAAVFGGHASGVHDVAFAPDQRTLAVVSGAGVVKFWSLAAGREAGVIELGSGTGLAALGFSPGGRWLGVVSPSGRLTLLAAPRGDADFSR